VEHSNRGPCSAILWLRWSVSGATVDALLPFSEDTSMPGAKTLSRVELTIRVILRPTEAYNMVPGRIRRTGSVPFTCFHVEESFGKRQVVLLSDRF
jgi:hypothetical protein